MGGLLGGFLGSAGFTLAGWGVFLAQKKWPKGRASASAWPAQVADDNQVGASDSACAADAGRAAASGETALAASPGPQPVQLNAIWDTDMLQLPSTLPYANTDEDSSAAPLTLWDAACAARAGDKPHAWFQALGTDGRHALWCNVVLVAHEGLILSQHMADWWALQGPGPRSGPWDAARHSWHRLAL